MSRYARRLGVSEYGRSSERSEGRWSRPTREVPPRYGLQRAHPERWQRMEAVKVSRACRKAAGEDVAGWDSAGCERKWAERRRDRERAKVEQMTGRPLDEPNPWDPAEKTGNPVVEGAQIGTSVKLPPLLASTPREEGLRTPRNRSYRSRSRQAAPAPLRDIVLDSMLSASRRPPKVGIDPNVSRKQRLAMVGAVSRSVPPRIVPLKESVVNASLAPVAPRSTRTLLKDADWPRSAGNVEDVSPERPLSLDPEVDRRVEQRPDVKPDDPQKLVASGNAVKAIERDAAGDATALCSSRTKMELQEDWRRDHRRDSPSKTAVQDLLNHARKLLQRKEPPLAEQAVVSSTEEDHAEDDCEINETFTVDESEARVAAEALVTGWHDYVSDDPTAVLMEVAGALALDTPSSSGPRLLSVPSSVAASTPTVVRGLPFSTERSRSGTPELVGSISPSVSSTVGQQLHRVRMTPSVVSRTSELMGSVLRELQLSSDTMEVHASSPSCSNSSLVEVTSSRSTPLCLLEHLLDRVQQVPSGGSPLSVCASEQDVPTVLESVMEHMSLAASERLSLASARSENVVTVAASRDSQATSKDASVQSGRVDSGLAEVVRSLANFLQRAPSDLSSPMSVGVSEDRRDGALAGDRVQQDSGNLADVLHRFSDLFCTPSGTSGPVTVTSPQDVGDHGRLAESPESSPSEFLTSQEAGPDLCRYADVRSLSASSASLTLASPRGVIGVLQQMTHQLQHIPLDSSNLPSVVAGASQSSPRVSDGWRSEDVHHLLQTFIHHVECSEGSPATAGHSMRSSMQASISPAASGLQFMPDESLAATVLSASSSASGGAAERAQLVLEIIPNVEADHLVSESSRSLNSVASSCDVTCASAQVEAEREPSCRSSPASAVSGCGFLDRTLWEQDSAASMNASKTQASSLSGRSSNNTVLEVMELLWDVENPGASASEGRQLPSSPDDMDSLSTLPESKKLEFQQSSLLDSGISSVDSGSLSVGKHIAGLRHHVAALPHSSASASRASASQLSGAGSVTQNLLALDHVSCEVSSSLGTGDATVDERASRVLGVQSALACALLEPSSLEGVETESCTRQGFESKVFPGPLGQGIYECSVVSGSLPSEADSRAPPALTIEEVHGASPRALTSRGAHRPYSGGTAVLEPLWELSILDSAPVSVSGMLTSGSTPRQVLSSCGVASSATSPRCDSTGSSTFNAFQLRFASGSSTDTNLASESADRACAELCVIDVAPMSCASVESRDTLLFPTALELGMDSCDSLSCVESRVSRSTCS